MDDRHFQGLKTQNFSTKKNKLLEGRKEKAASELTTMG